MPTPPTVSRGRDDEDVVAVDAASVDPRSRLELAPMPRLPVRGPLPLMGNVFC